MTIAEPLLAPTPILNFDHPSIARLVKARAWNTLSTHDRIGPVYDFASFLADPQVQQNGTVFEAVDERAGRMRFLGHAARYEATPAALTRMPPRLGEHTLEVLEELGYSEAEIRALRGQGVED